MAKRLSEKQKKEIIDLFVDGKSSLEDLSKRFDFSKLTISRNLKKHLGENIYKEFIKTKNNINPSKSSNEFKKDKHEENQSFSDKPLETSFVELAPMDYEIENIERKELSSVPISDMNFPKVVYMIVDKKIELEIKLLKDFPEWEFLPDDDLNRKTIEIFFDLNLAKRTCNKEQKVLKVPNTDVFRIAAPILIAKGISRIVCAENLIAL